MKLASSSLFVLINFFGLFLFTWPLLLDTESLGLASLNQATWLAALFGILCVAMIAFQINAKLLDSKIVAIVAVLVALISALRLLGAGAVGIEPMWFLIILAARALGPQIGFVIALMAILVSSLITGGIGPWLPFQALAAGWIAAGVVVIPKRLSFRLERVLLMAYGIFSALLFGTLMDLQLWPWLLGSDTQLSYLPGASITENLGRFLTFHFATALSWDLPRAIVTASLIFISAKSVLGALGRAKSRIDSVANWRAVNELGREQKVA
ncbi:MAG: ECF transporter S component [Candidatus Nanopelagicaceae bacterium]|nr:ECF transporter S component [Candidatus Nanopelagicaceae bacterium]